jgi:hypothetical protein
LAAAIAFGCRPASLGPLSAVDAARLAGVADRVDFVRAAAAIVLAGLLIKTCRLRRRRPAAGGRAWWSDQRRWAGLAAGRLVGRVLGADRGHGVRRAQLRWNGRVAALLALITPLRGLRAWWQALWRWARGMRRGARDAGRAATPAAPAPAARLPAWRQPRGARERVLFYYTSVLQRAAAAGLPRGAAQTPGSTANSARACPRRGATDALCDVRRGALAPPRWTRPASGARGGGSCGGRSRKQRGQRRFKAIIPLQSTHWSLLDGVAPVEALAAASRAGLPARR